MQFNDLVSGINGAVRASNWTELQHVCEQMRQFFPSVEDGYRYGVVACSGLSDFDTMDAILLSAMQLFPDNALYAYNYALSAEQRGALAEARLRWEIVSKTYESHPFAESWRREFIARHQSRFPDLQTSPVPTHDPGALATQKLYEALKGATFGVYTDLPTLWWHLDRSDASLSLVKVGASILLFCDYGDAALIRDVVAVLLRQPVRPDIDVPPQLVNIILEFKLRGSDKAHTLIGLLQDLVSDDTLSDVAGICALTFEIPLSPHHILRLVTRWLLAPGYWRFSQIFGNNDHLNVKPRKATCFVVPLVDMLIESNAIANLSHEQVYRLACVLYCTDRDAFLRLTRHCMSWPVLPTDYRNSVFGTQVMDAVATLPKPEIQTVQTGVAVLRNRDRRLRVAVCVSGQLRGFRSAIQSWDLLGLQEHDVDTYVHTWKVIGRRFPDALQAHRVFTGHFLAVYKDVYHRLSRRGIETQYPHFSRLFDGQEEVALDDLRTTYKTENIVIQDDRAADFQQLNTVMKMHYKIECCFADIARTRKDYDLILRIRPDLLVEGQIPLDLASLCQRSGRERVIYANFPAMISSGIVSWRLGACVPMMIGDLFALGTPASMKSYGSVYSDNLLAIQEDTFGLPKGFLAHTSLALLLMRAGVFVDEVPGLRMVDFCEPSPIAPTVLRQALQKDMDTREPIPSDALLLAALES